MALLPAPGGASPSPTLPVLHATLSLSDPAPRVGQPFILEIQIPWPGERAGYRLLPPRVQLPEGVEQQGVSAASDGGPDDRVLVYRLQLAALEPGIYELGPVEIRYATEAAAAPLQHELAGPTISVQTAGLTGSGWGSLAGWRGGALAAAFGVLAAGLVSAGLARRRRASLGPASHTDSAALELAAIRQHLSRARQWRLAGGDQEAFLELAAAAAVLSQRDAAVQPLPAEAVERARYGGWAPAAEELEHLARRLAASFTALEPDLEPAAADPREG